MLFTWIRRRWAIKNSPTVSFFPTKKLSHKSIQFFSRNGGDITWVNDKKETVDSLAAKQNCEELMKVIASHCGQQLIDRQMKIYDNHQNRYYDNHARTTTADGHRSS
jgi:hypothetical protein